MSRISRNLVLATPLLLLAAWLASGAGRTSEAADRSNPGDSTRAQQAADAIVAVAKESIATAANDDDAMQRVQMSLDALNIVGQLGKYDTNPQVDKLMDDMRSSGRPAVADSLIQLRLSSKLRQWSNLSDAQRTAAFEHFATDVKKSGLTGPQAKMALQITNMLDDSDGKLIAGPIASLAPLAHQSKDPEVRRMAPMFDGIARRLDLPGNPLELSGKLLDGTKLDWDSYRGKVVLVDFFASWCGPCRAEVPNILANYRAYHDKGFEVVGVNLDTERAPAEQYRTQTGFNFPTVFGDKPGANGWDLPVARKYGIAAIPRVILIDKEGNVVSTSARGERLGQLLGQLLGGEGNTANRRARRNADNTVKPLGNLSGEIGSVVPASDIEDAPSIITDEAAPDAVPDDK